MPLASGCWDHAVGGEFNIEVSNYLWGETFFLLVYRVGVSAEYYVGGLPVTTAI